MYMYDTQGALVGVIWRSGASLGDFSALFGVISRETGYAWQF